MLSTFHKKYCTFILHLNAKNYYYFCGLINFKVFKMLSKRRKKLIDKIIFGIESVFMFVSNPNGLQINAIS